MEAGWFLAVAALIGNFFLNSMSSGLRSLGGARAEAHLDEMGMLFWYRKVHNKLFHKRQLDLLFFALIGAKNICRVLYTLGALAIIGTMSDFPSMWSVQAWIGVVLLLVVSLLFGDFLPRNWARKYPQAALSLAAAPASFFLLIFLPLVYPFLLWSSTSQEPIYFEPYVPKLDKVKEKVLDWIYRLDIDEALDDADEKLLRSVMTFKGRLVREVMIPRVDICALPSDTTVQEAAATFLQEGFSRIPIYKETIDHMVGILYFKDLFRLILEEQDQSSVDDSKKAVWQRPIESCAKPVFYTPETRRLSLLLQEFRHKQSHLAIVVDEYGGTEGIITIEDILEEIVGKIADEYDEEEPEPFVAIPQGGWIVDGRMNVNELEDKIGLKIPHEGEYDTVGGYIVHRAGAIPSKGLKIVQDDFEIEVISATERAIEKVKITLRPFEAS